ncbi:MAG: class I SAM-dependent methyltransferase [Phycisphaerales bacterium]|nr:class I SAM-dependent methyltransferase [Phycisphaerales bacterium]
MNKSLTQLMKRATYGLHRMAAKCGMHITPVHHYSSLPNVAELKESMDEWRYPSEMPGIDIDLDAQAARLEEIVLPFEAEYRDNAAFKHGVESQFGPGYGPIEAQALHGFVRHFKPRRVIEVGSGISTHCMLEAMARNKEETGEATDMTCIEPFPYDWLKASPEITLIPKRVQGAGMDVYEQLEAGDLLFIDSSHTVKPGSDVNHIILEVFPRLKPGVLIHVHDIYFPYDFGRTTLKSYLHWSETSLLRAFMTNNDHVEIIFCLSQLFYDRRDVLAKVFPGFDPQPGNNGLVSEDAAPFRASAKHFPSSIYLQTR